MKRVLLAAVAVVGVAGPVRADTQTDTYNGSATLDTTFAVTPLTTTLNCGIIDQNQTDCSQGDGYDPATFTVDISATYTVTIQDLNTTTGTCGGTQGGNGFVGAHDIVTLTKGTHEICVAVTHDAALTNTTGTPETVTLSGGGISELDGADVAGTYNGTFSVTVTSL